MKSCNCGSLSAAWIGEPSVIKSPTQGPVESVFRSIFENASAALDLKGIGIPIVWQSLLVAEGGNWSAEIVSLSWCVLLSDKGLK